MKKLILAGALAVVATGCVSKSEYDKQLEQVAAISSEKDSLLKEVVATSQFIAEVNGELDKVKSGQPIANAAGVPAEQTDREVHPWVNSSPSSEGSWPWPAAWSC